MNFSTNQVMQFYVADSALTADNVVKYLDGSVAIKFPLEGDEYRMSDKIENVMWGKLTDAGALATPYMITDITLDSTVNGGAPIVGETYVVRVKYPEVAGLGVEGWTTKTAAVTVDSKTNTAETFFKALGEALKTAFEKDGVLEAEYDADGVTITAADVTKGYKRGIRPVMMPSFEVSASEVVLDGEYVQPFNEFKAVEADPEDKPAVKNGYKVAEMEYFALGERGDQYRDAAWPDAIISDYKVVPTQEYDVLTVHYAYKGANEGDYKSEKDLIIVGTKGSLNTLAGALETAVKVDFTKVDATGKEVAL